MKTKRQKDKDILPQSITTLSRILISASATAISGDPVLGSGAAAFLTETFFGIRSRLKLNRAENFIIEFSKYIKSTTPDFDIEVVDSEDFGDFFEQVLIKVSQTHSEIKLNGFKKLTANQILNPVSYDLAPKYLELISKINENHLILLRHWFFEELNYKSIIGKIHSERNRLKQEYDLGLNKASSDETYSQYQIRLLNYDLIDKENFRDKIKIKRKKLITIFKNDEFDFWAHDLRNLGVFEHDTTSNSYKGDRSFQYLYLSPFGKKAVEFIFN
ncbi:hypothetical protein F8C76_04540 [Flagellimonas olearia]|uniref:DUF4393 domain-containing protein n=1 Tax=Flagellimonas olearia TaxID=552546 RepID=A0A6I1E291_9FLAO|nr:hypothetical protein [Allomuricauda olearia]KAB7530772.1 hypothetical protein F8C76_04540 [Allomuricauda olearia]